MLNETKDATTTKGEKEQNNDEKDEKWNRPQNYYRKYEAKRREEAGTRKIRLSKLRKILKNILEPSQHEHIPWILCILDMEHRNHSYRRHHSYLEEYPGVFYTYGLRRLPSKSTIHAAAGRLAALDDAILASIMIAQDPKAACGTQLGDSSGFSFMRYEDWEDAKAGLVSRSLFVKLHILVSPHGPISSCTVTSGYTHDSPIFRDTLLERIPEGTGDIILDAAYFAKENCKKIKAKGRRPIIDPKCNYTNKGLSAYGDMLRWYESDPDGYKEAYSQRSLVETVFSSIKERFSAIVRARSLHMQKLRLTMRCICYNLIV